MAKLIKAYENENQAIYDARQDSSQLQRTYFNIVRLQAGESHSFSLPEMESLTVKYSNLSVSERTYGLGKQIRFIALLDRK